METDSLYFHAVIEEEQGSGMEGGGGMVAKFILVVPVINFFWIFLIKVILYVFTEQPTILSEPKLKGSSNVLKAKHNK